MNNLNSACGLRHDTYTPNLAPLPVRHPDRYSGPEEHNEIKACMVMRRKDFLTGLGNPYPAHFEKRGSPSLCRECVA